ncbi:MAG: hypothetical protein HYU52_09015 [Acidobacteria bacterium]|nr:hypothetical protein [Acidobacteriota bacterium]
MSRFQAEDRSASRKTDDEKTMVLSPHNRFPIAFELSSSSDGSLPPDRPRESASSEPSDAVTRVALRCGWNVTRDETRLVVDAGAEHRVLIEGSVAGARERLLRLRRPIPDATISPTEEAEMLRRNARTAHAGFALGGDGRAMLTATLTEPTVDEGELEAVLRSIIAGGDAVGVKAVIDFDPTTYRTAASAGSWEAQLLRESLGRAAIAFQFAGARCVASLALEQGRHKSVHILFDRADAWGDQLVQAISICAPAPPEWHRKALEANASLPLGALALATFGPLESLVAVRTMLARSLEPDTLLEIVVGLARIADKAEEHLLDSKNEHHS